MRFSILIPVYNTEKYLETCLQSVLQQGYADFEVILTDDGSTDDSKSICEWYAAHDNRIRFSSRANKGLLATRREQLTQARGEYILFLDSDDFWSDGILQVLSEQIDRTHPDMICFGYNRVDDAGNLFRKDIFYYDEDKEFSVERKNIEQFVKDFFKTEQLGYLWLKCVRKAIIDIENTYDAFTDVYGEDSLQSAEIVCRARSVQYLRKACVNYRQSFIGKGRNFSPSYTIDNMWVRDYMYQRITAHHLGNDIINAFYARCFHFIQYQFSCLLKACKSYRELNHYYRAMQAYPIFRSTFDYIYQHEWSKVDFKARLMFQSPITFYYLLKLKGVLKIVLNKIRFIKALCKYILPGWFLFLRKGFKQKQIPAHIYKSEFKKYNQNLRHNERKDLVYAQLRAFLTSSFSLVSDNLKPSDNKNDPMVFVVVRNELERMKVFFEHYRRLGVTQFVTLDNGSDDGTLEFLSLQPGTRVYQILDAFQTQKKEAWIEKLLVMNGLDRWCIVVDSDELLDYVGSEKHPIGEMIQKAKSLGYKRIWGYMLDMYAPEPLFAPGKMDEPLTHHFRYFDRDSYMLNLKNDSQRIRSNDEIYGGPRLRVLGRVMTLSKQSIFFFDKEMLYGNCHYLYPLIKWGEVPCWFVLRHYKFLPGDKGEYTRRIREKCFYNNSIEYQDIMKRIQTNDVYMYHENSQEYTDSYSLQCLPYLQQIQW